MHYLKLFLVLLAGDIVGGVIVRFLTKHKYFWCKRDCSRCGNWHCKLWKKPEE